MLGLYPKTDTVTVPYPRFFSFRRRPSFGPMPSYRPPGTAASGAAASPSSGWKDGAKADEAVGHGEAGSEAGSLPATAEKRMIFVVASFLYALSFTVITPHAWRPPLSLSLCP